MHEPGLVGEPGEPGALTVLANMAKVLDEHLAMRQEVFFRAEVARG